LQVLEFCGIERVTEFATFRINSFNIVWY